MNAVSGNKNIIYSWPSVSAVSCPWLQPKAVRSAVGWICGCKTWGYGVPTVFISLCRLCQEFEQLGLWSPLGLLESMTGNTQGPLFSVLSWALLEEERSQCKVSVYGNAVTDFWLFLLNLTDCTQLWSYIGFYLQHAFSHPSWRRQWHPTPVLLPGKSRGWRSLVGCSAWGR